MGVESHILWTGTGSSWLYSFHSAKNIVTDTIKDTHFTKVLTARMIDIVISSTNEQSLAADPCLVAAFDTDLGFLEITNCKQKL